MASKKDLNPKYWSEYSNLQGVKHALIEEYLKGWLPKLGRHSKRILYLDTHAGRGKHTSGRLGSPLVALKALFDHKHREGHFGDCEIRYYFIEADDENCRILREEIAKLGGLPPKVHVTVIPQDCFEALDAILEHLREKKQQIAPAFIFVDPYGFRLPGRYLRELMSYPRVELFVNVIWRWLYMAITQAEKPGMAKTLDEIYEGDRWRHLAELGFDEAVEGNVNLLKEITAARWATSIRMLGENGATKYLLVHLTNHEAGRDLMKDCMWKVCPEFDGDFFARASDDPRQQVLLTAEPNLKPLQQWVIEKLGERPRRWQELHVELREEDWRGPHLNKTVSQLRKDRVLDGRSYQGEKRFVPSRNPELYLLEERT